MGHDDSIFSNEDVRFETSEDGKSSLSGRITIKPAALTGRNVRQDLDTVMATVNNLVDESRVANGKRHDEIAAVQTSMEEQLKAKVATLQESIASLQTHADAAKAQWAEASDSITNASDQIKRLDLAIEKASEQTSEQFAKQSADHARRADEAAANSDREFESLRNTIANRDAKLDQTQEALNAQREQIDSLHATLLALKDQLQQLATDAADQNEALSAEIAVLRQTVSRTRGRLSVVTTLGFIGGLVLLAAIAAVKYL